MKTPPPPFVMRLHSAPDYGEAHAGLSLALLELGQLEEAQEHAQKSILLKPRSAQAYAELADVLFAADLMDEAEAALQDVGVIGTGSAARLSETLRRAGTFQPY